MDCGVEGNLSRLCERRQLQIESWLVDVVVFHRASPDDDSAARCPLLRILLAHLVRGRVSPVGPEELVAER